MDTDIKEQILNAARKKFAQFGFKKTTMDDIAHAIYKGKSSIYHYFKSKEEIFAGVIENEYTYLKKNIEEALKNQDSPKEKLRTYVLTRLKILSELSNFYTALRDDYLEHLEMIEKLREQYTREEIDMLIKILQEGIDRGVFKNMNTEVTAHTVIMALKGLEHYWAQEANQKELEKEITNLFNMLFYGMVER